MKWTAVCLVLVVGLWFSPPAVAGPRTPEEAWRQMQARNRANRPKPPRKRVRVTAPRHPLNTGRTASDPAKGSAAKDHAKAGTPGDTTTGAKAPTARIGPKAEALKKRIATAQATMARLLRKVATRLEKSVARRRTAMANKAQDKGAQQKKAQNTAAQKKTPGQKSVKAGADQPGAAEARPARPKPITAEALLGNLRMRQFQGVNLETLGMLRTGRLVTEAEYDKLVKMRVGLSDLENQLRQHPGPPPNGTQPPPSGAKPPPSTTNPFDEALQ